MVDYLQAIPMFVDRQRVFIEQNDHTFVVVHKTAGFHTAQEVAQFFATDPNEASTHFVIGQDGVVVQCVLLVDGAGGNCCLETGHAPYLPQGVNLNTKTISIEHVDPAIDNSTPLTDVQKAASFALIKWICEQFNIPMRPGDAAGGIIGHHDIDPINRARCPGNYPWDELWQYLQEKGNVNMGIPAGWQDDGTTLTAPNGHKVIKGFREYILTHVWDAHNLPLEDEHPQNPLEENNPALGGGTQQIFNWTTLEWDPQRNVQIMYTGKELLSLRNEIATLKAKIHS